MGNFTYLRNDQNRAVGATLTPTSADANFPAANINTLPIAQVFRFTGDTSENMLFDFGTAQAVDLVAVINHNLTSAATINVRAGTTSAVTDFGPDAMSWREFDAFDLYTSTETYRYWRIDFADAANPDGYIEIGYAMLGDSTTLSFNHAYGWQFVDLFDNLEVRSEFGVPHIAELYDQVLMRMRFRNISEADADTVRTFYRALKRNVVPLFLVPDSEVNDGYFGRITNDLRETRDFLRDLDLSFVADGRGDRIGA